MLELKGNVQDRETNSSGMIHIVDEAVDPYVALCGMRVQGEWVDPDEEADCIVCAELEKLGF